MSNTYNWCFFFQVMWFAHATTNDYAKKKRHTETMKVGLWKIPTWSSWVEQNLWRVRCRRWKNNFSCYRKSDKSTKIIYRLP